MNRQYQQMMEELRRRVQEVTPEEAQADVDEGKEVVLLDVREPDEWARGRIPGAVHVPLRSVSFQCNPASPTADARLTDHKDQRVVVYCAKGNRSLMAADALKKMGYRDVVSMKGGIVDWAKEGYPVER
jgi:rhodanese-related sulfurtransferase